MYCPYCAEKDIDQYAFCPKCAMSLSVITGQAAAEQAGATQPARQRRETHAAKDLSEGFFFGIGGAFVRCSPIIMIGGIAFQMGYSFGLALLILSGIGVIWGAANGVKNYRQGYCPYCGLSMYGIAQDDSLRCKACKKHSVIKEDKFIAID